MRSLSVVIALVFVGLGLGAQCFYVEPGFYMRSSTYDYKAISGFTSSGKSVGSDINLKAGWVLLGRAFAALEYTDIKGTSKEDLAADDRFSGSSFGLIIGAELPVGVRIWAGSVINPSLKFDSGSELSSGTGYKLGIGFKVMPFISLNLEQITSSFGKNTTPTGTSSFEFKDTATMMGISAPLSLDIFSSSEKKQ